MNLLIPFIVFLIIGIGMYFVNEFLWICCLVFSGFCLYCIYRFITEVIL